MPRLYRANDLTPMLRNTATIALAGMTSCASRRVLGWRQHGCQLYRPATGSNTSLMAADSQAGDWPA